MTKKISCAIALMLAASGSVHAGGFIDERSAVVNPAQVASPVGRLLGDFAAAEWNQIAPPSGVNGSALSLAVIRLLPLNRPPVELDAPEAIVDKLVSWGAGLTRRQALEEIAARNSVNITIEPRTITIRPIAVNPRNMPATVAGIPGMPPGARVMPPGIPGMQPGAVTQKAFEVRLTDIKLSTSMNRWATENGVRLRWDADKHVLVGAPQTFRANTVFEAIAQALGTPGIKNSDYPLEVCEYPNQPPLLRITRQGEQAKDCPSL